MFFYKIHICNYDDQGFDANQYLQNPSLLGSNFVTFKIFTESYHQYFQKFGFTLNHLDRSIFDKINIWNYHKD